VSNLDFLSLRARAGWVLGNFLPYGFVGFALGRADIAVAANVSVIQCPSVVIPTLVSHGRLY
jgi:opacity protein-like surface antigen